MYGQCLSIPCKFIIPSCWYIENKRNVVEQSSPYYQGTKYTYFFTHFYLGQNIKGFQHEENCVINLKIELETDRETMTSFDPAGSPPPPTPLPSR